MQFIALNKDYSINSVLAPINVQWTRQYYQTGAFSIQIPYTQYDKEMCYIYTKDRPELGIITQVNYIWEKGKKNAHISGNFLEHELNDKIVHPQFKGSGILEDEIVRLVNEYKDDIPLLEDAVSQGRGDVVNFTAFTKGIGEELYNILPTHEFSFRINFDYIANKKTFELWQGKDRTQAQGTENFVTFSTAFKNLLEPNLVILKNSKNWALVKGSYNGSDIYQEVDLSGGEYKRKICIDANVDAEDMTEAQYKQKLTEYGQNELLSKYMSVQNVTFKVNSKSYEYLKDYDLGDKCDIIINDIGVALEARIITIYEVWKNNTHQLTLEFGNQKIKRRS